MARFDGGLPPPSDREALAQACAGIRLEWVALPEAGLLLAVATARDELERLEREPLLLVAERVEIGEVVEAGGADAWAPDSDRARLERFVEVVAVTGQIWCLRGATWARANDASGREAIPFWSSEAAAARCAIRRWTGFAPQPIDLDTWLTGWLQGMAEDGIVAVVATGPTHAGVAVAPDWLAGAVRSQHAQPRGTLPT